MDDFKKSIITFNSLMNKDYYFILEDNSIIRTYFAKKHFYHMLGLNKLKDLPLLNTSKNNTTTSIYNKILDGKITYSQIKKSKYFHLIKGRVENFSLLSDMLQQKNIIYFDKTRTPSNNSKIKSNIIFHKKINSNHIHLCLAKEKDYFYPETFIVHNNNFYIRNQKILNISELKILESKTNKVLVNNKYLSNNLEEVAAAIDLSKSILERMDGFMNDKVKEIMDNLEKGIKETMNSEKYKEFLKVQSQFHRYSFNNAMLIYLQRPDATRVAGYKAWEKMGRYVMRGEKGISILAPSPYKYEKLVDKIDPKTKQPLVDSKGDIIKEKKVVEGITFRKVSVFDIKQTDGKELPSICNELQGNSINSENVIKAIKQISEVPIIEQNIESGAKGYYSRFENIIAIQQDMSLDQTAKTLIHEYAHSQLHNTDAAALLDRATKEVQAESVAYIVSNRFGIDTSEYSFEYLANWSSGKELPELKASFDLIQKTADQIIQKIEDVITKELELQNSPATIVIQWSESNKLQKGQILDIVEANKLFVKLDQEQTELMKNNPKIDFSKVTTGEKVDLVPYLKTKFEIRLSDGRTSEARFDFGNSEYKDLFDCIKHECHIDVQEYIKQYEANTIKEKDIPTTSNLEQENIQSIKNKIIELYSKEFPAIKHISEDTARFMDHTNQIQGKIVSIKELKQAYKHAGEWLEKSNNPGERKVFEELQKIVDDFKQAQLTEKQVNAQNKVNELNKSKSFELVQ